MNPILIVLVWAVVPIGLVVAFWFAHIANKKRKEGIAKYAADLGLQSKADLSAKDNGRFQRFKLSDQGRSKQASNVIEADSGELRMVLFDYQYTTGSGKSKTTHRQSVVMATAVALQMPEFSLSPESFFHRLGDLFGFKDIDFEEDQAFSDKFLLKGEREEAIRNFFDASRRAALMNHQDVTLEGNGDSFIFYIARKRWNVEEMKTLMEKAFSIYQVLA